MSIEIIQKIDAARRQLDTAITLWFQEGDVVSIHTLTCAAHQIIHDLNRHRNGPDLLFDSIVVKDEFRHLIKKYLHKEYNFFKHANNDPDNSLEFNPSNTEHFILFTILGLEMLGIKSNNLQFTFTIFFAIRHPHLITDIGLQLFYQNIPSEQFDNIRKLNRSQFFKNFNLLFRETTS